MIAIPLIAGVTLGLFAAPLLALGAVGVVITLVVKKLVVVAIQKLD
jgi:hypothetical protein